MSRSCTLAGRTSSGALRASRSRRSPRRSGTVPVAARPRDADAASAVPEELALSRAAQQALALAQQEKSAWTRADLVKYLGRVLPRSGRDPARAAALLEETADRILRSEFDPVVCLEAPEPAGVPRAYARRRAQASTAAMAACATPRAPSCPWKTAWSRRQRRRPRLACHTPLPPKRLARMQNGWWVLWKARRTTRTLAGAPGRDCARIRPPPSCRC
jgi:hypothetical protein